MVRDRTGEALVEDEAVEDEADEEMPEDEEPEADELREPTPPPTNHQVNAAALAVAWGIDDASASYRYKPREAPSSHSDTASDGGDDGDDTDDDRHHSDYEEEEYDDDFAMGQPAPVEVNYCNNLLADTYSSISVSNPPSLSPSRRSTSHSCASLTPTTRPTL